MKYPNDNQRNAIQDIVEEWQEAYPINQPEHFSVLIDPVTLNDLHELLQVQIHGRVVIKDLGTIAIRGCVFVINDEGHRIYESDSFREYLGRKDSVE